MKTNKNTSKAYHSGESEADNSQTPWWVIRQIQVVANIEIVHDVCAQKTSAKADNYWSVEDDALTQHWMDIYLDSAGMPKHSGCNLAAWMNPPFSLAKEFTTKAADEALEGVVTIGCVKHAPDTDWFQEMEKRATFIYVPDGRIHFLKSDGTPFERPEKKKGVLTGRMIKSGANFPVCFPLWTPFYNGGDAKQIRFKRNKEKYTT